MPGRLLANIQTVIEIQNAFDTLDKLIPLGPKEKELRDCVQATRIKCLERLVDIELVKEIINGMANASKRSGFKPPPLQ